jgi:hypothetical protein
MADKDKQQAERPGRAGRLKIEMRATGSTPDLSDVIFEDTVDLAAEMNSLLPFIEQMPFCVFQQPEGQATISIEYGESRVSVQSPFDARWEERLLAYSDRLAASARRD